MWPDPTDTSTRKPRRIKGTPAARYFTGVTLIGIAISLVIPYFWSLTSNCERKVDILVEYNKNNSEESALADSILRRAPMLREKLKEIELK